jgi:hypothetical protein
VAAHATAVVLPGESVRTAEIGEDADAAGAEARAAGRALVLVIAGEVEQHADAEGRGAERIVFPQVAVGAVDVDDDAQPAVHTGPARRPAVGVVAAEIDDHRDLIAGVLVAALAAHHEAPERQDPVEQHAAHHAARVMAGR